MDERYRSRRRLFNEVAELYDRARPQYPQAIIDDLIAAAELGPDSRILEIGCGTGQLTGALAEHGLSVFAVELGEQLAQYTRHKLDRYDGIEIIVADFDDWTLPRRSFDCVVSASAFHWLNPLTRVGRCADVLRQGGTLAIVDAHWAAGSGHDRFFVENRKCYAQWDTDQHPAFEIQTRETLPTANADLEASGRFDDIRLKRYETRREYDSEGYCELISTFSGIQALDDSARRGFLNCMADLINTRFDGRIVREDIYSLWLARTVNAL